MISNILCITHFFIYFVTRSKIILELCAPGFFQDVCLFGQLVANNRLIVVNAHSIFCYVNNMSNIVVTVL